MPQVLYTATTLTGGVRSRSPHNAKHSTSTCSLEALNRAFSIHFLMTTDRPTNRDGTDCSAHAQPRGNKTGSIVQTVEV